MQMQNASFSLDYITFCKIQLKCQLKSQLNLIFMEQQFESSSRHHLIIDSQT